MIQKHERSTKSYVSCIKINGVPILPPLITADKIAELHKYKQKALEIEKQLEFKKNNLSVSQHSNSDNQSHITKLTTSESDNIDKHLSTCKSATENINAVPYKSENNVNLTCNIVDISEYSDDGVRFFDDSISCPSNCDTERNIFPIPLDVPALNLTQKQSSSDTEASTLEGFSVAYQQMTEACSISPVKPRLIRSNSYTLESPSPVLLAHLEKQRSEEGQKYEFKSLRNWCSLDNGKLTQGFGDSSAEIVDKAPEKSDIRDESGDGLKDTEPAVEKVDLIELEKEFVSNEIENCGTNEPVNESTENGTTHCDLKQFSDIEKQLLDVLNNVPEKYTKQILDLLEKRIQNEIQTPAFTEIRKILLQPEETSKNQTVVQKLDENAPKLPEPCAVHPVTPHSDCLENTNSFTSSQTIYYTINSSSETLNALSTPLDKLIDTESDSDVNDNKKTEKSPPEAANKPLSSRNICKTLIHESVNCTVRNILNCSKELFPQEDVWIQPRLRQEWAASVIGAHAKGYLVRRLMATERVRGLIQTIKDALICAMELHSESTENIDASDVELHRRLIQQVSAACYAFHDIFFTLSIPEQMAIIANDRLRQLEKLKRPSSVKSARMPGSKNKVVFDRNRPGSARLFRNKVSF